MILIINLRQLLVVFMNTIIAEQGLRKTNEHPLTEFISQEGIDGN